MHDEHAAHEALIRKLNDPEKRAEYLRPFDAYRPGIVPRTLGWLLVFAGTIVYGPRPSYAKFKAVEVIARIPYQSWEVAVYTLLTAFYANEARAMRLAHFSKFSRAAQDNETMHVVVISQITRRMHGEHFFRHTFIPLIFSFFYFWSVYLLSLISQKAALELNYLFESHAYAQYSEFLERYGDDLKKRTVNSDYLRMYGRTVANEYELFALIRNDEAVHRNRSIEEIQAFENQPVHQSAH